jgi:hypothetical protein
MPVNPSFPFGADQSLYPSRGIMQGIGFGAYAYDDKPKFKLNWLAVGSPLGLGPLEGRIARVAPDQTANKQFKYVKCVTVGGLPPNGESIQAAGFFNRSGVTIPQNKYFWAVKG